MSEENFDEEKQNEKMSEKQYQKRTFSQAKENWKNCGVFKKLWMIFLALVVGGGLVAVAVLIFIGLIVPMLITLGVLFIFVGCLICGVMVVGKIRLSKKHINWDIPAIEGNVISCSLFTETTSKDQRGKVDVVSSVYQMKVDVEGKKKTVYTSKPYNVGSKVLLRQHKLFKRLLIVEE